MLQTYVRWTLKFLLLFKRKNYIPYSFFETFDSLVFCIPISRVESWSVTCYMSWYFTVKTWFTFKCKIDHPLSPFTSFTLYFYVVFYIDLKERERGRVNQMDTLTDTGNPWTRQHGKLSEEYLKKNNVEYTFIKNIQKPKFVRFVSNS